MPRLAALPRRVKTMLTVLWAVVLGYGPVSIFIIVRFYWQLPVISHSLFIYSGYLAIVSWILAMVTTIFLLFRAPRIAVLSASIVFLDLWLLFSPIHQALEVKSFADFTKPTDNYVKKHCAPMSFVQGGKIYVFGICNLIINQYGQDDFDFVYDTSGDIGNYDKLSPADQKLFATTVRKYYNDDPNAGFEYANFTASRYYRDFFYVEFDQAETEGFTATYGMPPKDRKNPYRPIF